MTYPQKSMTGVLLMLNWVAVAGEIHQAVLDGNLTRVKSLLQSDPKLITSADLDVSGSLPLHLAAYARRSDVLAYLLEQRPHLEATNKWGATALHSAVAHGRIPAVEMLLRAGVAVDPRDGLGETPLHKAAGEGYIEAARLLLEFGALVNARNSSKATPLYLAA